MPHLGGDVVGRLGGDDGARPPVVAARASVTDGSSSRSRTIASIASRAWLARLGDHRGDRLADVARELVRQGAAQRGDGAASVGAPEVRGRRHALDAGGRQLGAGEDAEHPRHGARGGHVDADDARMRVRRAQEGDHRLAGHGDVVGEPAAALEQGAVLDSRHGAAAAETRYGVGCIHG